MRRFQDHRPPDWGPPPPTHHRDHHCHYNNQRHYQPQPQPQDQPQRHRPVQPPPLQFFVILLCPDPDFSVPTATEVEALVASLPSPAPARLSVHSSGRSAARLVFRSLQVAADTARELWALRLEGLHSLTPRLPEPALASHARPLIASLFADHTSRLLDSGLVNFSAARSAELAVSIQDVKKRLRSRNRFCDFSRLRLQQKTLEAEKALVDAKIAEYKAAMRSIHSAMLCGTEEEAGVDVFGILKDGELDFARVHMMMLRE